MIVPTAHHLLAAHKRIGGAYPVPASAGSPNRGKINSIVEKPFMSVYGCRKYETIHQQAACLMEGIIRLHPFPDGNKRTALLMASSFLRANGIHLVIPLDAVRFMISVARDDSVTGDEVDELIRRISRWLEERSAAGKEEISAKTWRYVDKPLWRMALLSLTGVGMVFARRMFRDWLAMDVHPNYAKSRQETVRLILGMTFGNMRAALPRQPAHRPS